MEKTLTRFTEKRRSQKYCITEWKYVIHMRQALDDRTLCGLPITFDVTREEAWTSSMNLCNGCFR